MVSSPLFESGKTYNVYTESVTEENLTGSFTASANSYVGTSSGGIGMRNSRR